jgi:NAD(P)-dependent dehydrogenase (short-subunit alcohol dehydrogenase family)
MPSVSGNSPNVSGTSPSVSVTSTTSASKLEGRTALITGASGGIGRAIALELSRLGARVFAVGRNLERLNATCAAIRAEGGSAEPIAVDITTSEGLRALEPATAVSDVLVNNAAAFPPYGWLEEISEADMRRVHDTVAIAPARLCGAVLPGMKQRSFGRILNIGSIAAALGAERQAVYTSAKSALYGLTRSIALEGARFGVTCNVVDFGLFETDRVRATVPIETRRAIIASTPLKRAGTVEEAAAVVAFLASPRAGFITGAVIPVTGGLEIGLYQRPEEQR